jgi:hypothetical protein
MATPGELVKAIAAVLGIPEPTAVQYDRQLAEAGLRTKGGRGRSAARVTARDASNLLIAIAASPVSGPSVKEAAKTCETYASLPFLVEHSLPKFSEVGLPALDQLPPTHTLGEATALLIASAARGEEVTILHDQQTVRRGLSITFFGPQTAAEIWCNFLIERKVYSPGHMDWRSQPAFFRYTSMQYEFSAFNSFEFMRLGLEQSAKHLGDLGQIRTVTGRTIDALGKLLGPGQEGR